MKTLIQKHKSISSVFTWMLTKLNKKNYFYLKKESILERINATLYRYLSLRYIIVVVKR